MKDQDFAAAIALIANSGDFLSLVVKRVVLGPGAEPALGAHNDDILQSNSIYLGEAATSPDCVVETSFV